jgi:ribosomal protein S8
MSRIGKLPVAIPKGVTVNTEGSTVTVKGAKGELKRVSSPGLRQYVGVQEIPRVRNGLGVAILSTSKGLMSDREARQSRTGGELLALVW